MSYPARGNLLSLPGQGALSLDTRGTGYSGTRGFPTRAGFDTSGVTAFGDGGGGLGLPGLPELGKAGLDIAQEWIRQKLGLNGGGGGVAETTPVQQQQCPPGSFEMAGRCVAPGDMWPGGDPGVFEAGGKPVSSNGRGSMGMIGVTPTIVGSINGRPVRRCPSRYVLGEDNVCYHKAVIPRSLRKWRPARKPPVTAADAVAIRRADSARKRVKKLAGRVGFTCSTKGRGSTRKRKK